MEKEIILTKEIVINALKESYTIREAVAKIYGTVEKRYEKRLSDFSKSNGIDQKSYLLKKPDEHYYCKFCGKEILGEYRKYKKFCNSSCAAKYNNKGRKRDLESRIKTANSVSEKYWKTHNKEKGKKQLRLDEQRAKRYLKFDRNKKYYCLNCGKEIENPRPSKDNMYCSFTCQKEYLYKSYIDRWKNGEETGIVGKYDISNHVRRYMLEKAGHKCERCGWNEVNPATGNIPLHIHHIDGDCTNNTEENLQVLCPNCHSLTDNYGSRNKNATVGRTEYHTSKYKNMKYKHIE